MLAVGDDNPIMLEKEMIGRVIGDVKHVEYEVIEENVKKWMSDWPVQKAWSGGKGVRFRNGDAGVNGSEVGREEFVGGRVDEEWYKDYRTWKDIETRIQGWQEKGDDRVEVFEVGVSVEGRSIWGVRIHSGRVVKQRTDSDGRLSVERQEESEEEAAPKRILINGVQHAREWISGAVAMYVADKLVSLVRSSTNATEGNNNAQPGNKIDQEIVNLFNSNVEVVVVPVVNPDGYVYTREVRFWRKNRRVYNSLPGNASGKLCPGVDLNRNWGVDFGGPESTTKISTCSEIFIGEEAFSEPESAAMKRLIENNNNWKAHVDLHSFGQLILGPWGYTGEEPPRAKEIDGFGAGIQKAIKDVNGEIYNFGRGDSGLLYLASGIAPDWSFSNGIMGATIELRPNSRTSEGFLLNSNEILPTAKEIFNSVHFLMRYANNSRVAFENDPIPVQSGDISDNDGGGLKVSSITIIATVLSLGLVALALAFVGIWYFVRRRRRGPELSTANEEGADGTDGPDIRDPPTQSSAIGRPPGVPVSPPSSVDSSGRFSAAPTPRTPISPHTPWSPRSPRTPGSLRSPITPRSPGARGLQGSVGSAVEAARVLSGSKSPTHSSSSTPRRSGG